MEREVFCLGIWRNFDEIEENLTLDELNEILKAVRDKEHREFKFFAALKGIDLDDGDEETETIADVQRRVRARQLNVSEESLHLQELGFEVEISDE